MRQMMGFFKDSDHRQDEQECLWTFPGFGLTKILDISRLSNKIMLFQSCNDFHFVSMFTSICSTIAQHLMERSTSHTMFCSFGVNCEAGSLRDVLHSLAA